LPDALAAYEQRDRRSAGMTDESVEEFYSCALCQSFAPNHICIIKPERPGLCGAYTWLDGKSSYEIDPTGPNQPVKKGQVLDPVKGQWQGVNEFVVRASNQTVEKFNAYTLMEYPETSCGCFECIIAILPEANGFIIVNREYNGMTPTGMSFSTLAGSVGGGVQSPGFMGIGRKYIVSKKFISADGGLKRIVWMPSELKEALREEMQKRASEAGEPDLLDKIADETNAIDSDQVLEYLNQIGHPALTMEPLI
jgi:acetyl-CoA synthase